MQRSDQVYSVCMNVLWKVIRSVRVKALSLVEVSISLVIIGLLIAGALQGWKWVDSAKVTTTINQVLQIQAAAQAYKNTHGGLPEAQVFWQELQEFGGPTTRNGQAVSALGARFEYQQHDNNVQLSPLTAAQGLQIKNALDRRESLDQGWIRLSGDRASLDMASKAKSQALLISL